MYKKRLNPLHFQIIIILLLSLWGWYLINSLNGNSQLNLMLLCWINSIAFLIQIRLLKSVVGSYVNPIVLFSIFLFMFSSGQLILYSFSININDFNIFNRLDHEVLQYAILYLILGYAVYQLGVLIAIRKKNIYVTFISSPKMEPNKIIFTIGLLFFIIGFIPYMVNMIYSFIVVSSLGYSAYYQEGVRLNNLLIGLGYYIFTGLILIVAAGKMYQKKLAIGFLVLIAIMRLLSGDRGDSIVYIFTAYMLYIYFINQGKSSVLKTGILVIITMSFVPVIGVLRHSASMENNPSIFSIFIENNIFLSTLSNLGATAWPLAKIMEIFPTYQDYLSGGTYMAALILLIPSFLRIGFLSDIDRVFTGPAGWLMEYLRMSYGPGFTPFAESFMNFGWWGILFMGVFGFSISKLLSIKSKHVKDVPLMLGLSILCFLFFAMGARGSFNYMVAFFIRYVLIPFLLIRVVEFRFQRKVRLDD
jgi:oligosaccharide repeat unit polymerase